MALSDEFRAMFLLDPRVSNNILPFQSSVTYKFGARSYITSVYPQYTWRNGTWFLIDKDLSFKKDTIKRYERSVLTLKSISTWLEYSHINDSWDPITIGTHRYFILYVSRYAGIIYNPITKSVCSSEYSGIPLLNPKYEDVHSDDEYSELFTNWRSIFVPYSATT
jgi:hypothetical protein